MAYLFISYTHKDLDMVNRFAEGLQDRGYEVWIDHHNLRAGEQWETEIKEGIKSATYLLLVATKNAAESDWVKREVQFATAENVKVIPIIIDLSTLTTFGVDKTQGVSFPATMDNDQNFQASFDNLVKNLTALTPDSRGWNIQKELKSAKRDDKFSKLLVNWRAVEKDAFYPLSGLRVDYTLYGMEAYLVAASDEPLKVHPSVQVFIQCTGNADMRGRFKHYRQYFEAHNKPMWTLVISGPIEGDKYKLPNDPGVWNHVVEFTFRVLQHTAVGAQWLEFFLDTPVALGMMIGMTAQSKRKDIGSQFVIYHFDEDARYDKDKYFKVME